MYLKDYGEKSISSSMEESMLDNKYVEMNHKIEEGGTYGG